MKHMFTSILVLFALLPVLHAQTVKQDTIAIMILDRMSSVVGDLTSVHFKIETRQDEAETDAGIISHFGESDVYFSGADKMLVLSHGDKGHRGYWYNGEQLAYYSFNENNYAVIPTPLSTIETFDSLHKCYDFDFPAADFFYPTFTEDLLAQFDQITYNGKKLIEGKECFYIVARNEQMQVQFWFANDAMNMPVKMFITQLSTNPALQYEATFSNWELNPDLPPSIFEFAPPPQARRISILSKCDQ